MSYLKIKLQGIKYYPNGKYIGIGIKNDHFHLYIIISPKFAIIKVTETIKMNTSKTVKLKFTLFDEVYKNVKII